MSNQRYPEEFKIEAVKQVTERGLRVADVAERLGVSAHSLYAWVKRYSKPQAQRQQVDDQQAELRRLRAELKRVTEERDILKKAAAYFAKESGGSTPSSASCRWSTRYGVSARPSRYIPAVTTPGWPSRNPHARRKISACSD